MYSLIDFFTNYFHLFYVIKPNLNYRSTNYAILIMP